MSDYSLFQIVMIGGYCLVSGVAHWRQQHDDEARAFRQQVLEAALDDARLDHAQLSQELGVGAPQWSRDLANGANFTAWALAARKLSQSVAPEFGAALVERLAVFFGLMADPNVARRERLSAAMAVQRVPRKAELGCQESDSSAA